MPLKDYSNPLLERENRKYEWRMVYIVLGVFAVIIVKSVIDRKEVLDQGVYTKGTALDTDGRFLTVEYRFEGKTRHTDVRAYRDKSAIGHQFFLKVLRQDPDGPLFVPDEDVPDCLLNVAAPDSGWTHLPTCP